jgi:hypothetical protein
MNISKIKFATLIVLSVTIVLMSRCAPPKSEDKITFIEKRNIDLEDTLPNGKKIEGDAHGGKYFSRADSASIYGCGTIFKIQDSLLKKDLRVKMNAWFRVGNLQKDKKYAISLEDVNGQVINWSQIDLKSYVSEPNKWVNVIDSVTISGNLINNSGLLIKTYSFNPEAHSTLDADDVELSLYKVEKK